MAVLEILLTLLSLIGLAAYLTYLEWKMSHPNWMKDSETAQKQSLKNLQR